MNDTLYQKYASTSSTKRGAWMSALVVIVTVLAACRGEEEPLPSGPRIAPGFAGTWSGTTQYTISGLDPIRTTGSLAISLLDDITAVVRGMCPNGEGQIAVIGEGSDLGWSGSVTCAPVAFADCASVTPTYVSARFTLYAGSSLVVSGSGTASGCGVSRPFTASFEGSR